MRDSPDSRDRLVDAALYLFWKQGYHATSVADILAHARVNAGSLYYFFKTKQALLHAVLERYLASLDAIVMDPVADRVPDSIDRIFGVLEFYRQNLLATDLTYGCPIGRLALEMPDDDATTRALIAANFAAWSAAIEAWIRQARRRLAAHVDPAALAQFVLTVMEGAVMQARTHRDIAYFDASIRQLRRHFHALTRKTA
jgi:TetR/AcrR family transcriptional regulator, transcriptional repressor for nem operon